MRILYPNGDDGVAIIIPNLNCGLTVEQIAAKDVPSGTPYLIVDVADIPADRTFREAWEADFSKPDGRGADFGSGSNWTVVSYGESGEVNCRYYNPADENDPLNGSEKTWA